MLLFVLFSTPCFGSRLKSPVKPNQSVSIGNPNLLSMFRVYWACFRQPQNSTQRVSTEVAREHKQHKTKTTVFAVCHVAVVVVLFNVALSCCLLVCMSCFVLFVPMHLFFLLQQQQH